MATSVLSLHGASWPLVWGAGIGVVLWAIITSVLDDYRHRAVALVGMLLFLALYTASEQRRGEEFRRATPVQKEEAEEFAAEGR